MVTLKDIMEKFEAEAEIKKDEKVSFFELLTPAFVGGIIIGIIVGIPGINLLIPLIPIGGYVAVQLVYEYYEKKCGEKDGVKVGAVAGFIGAFIGTLLIMVIAAFFAEEAIKFFRMIMDPKTAELILTLSGLDPYVSLITLRIRFVVNVVICTALGAIGGWINVKKLILMR